MKVDPKKSGGRYDYALKFCCFFNAAASNFDPYDDNKAISVAFRF